MQNTILITLKTYQNGKRKALKSLDKKNFWGTLFWNAFLL